jgi:elongation factor P
VFTATELKEGMVIRIEGQLYRVPEAESKAGTAKLGGVVKTKLSNVRSGHIWEPHFRPQERVEEVQLERRVLEFVYAAGDTCTFMSPRTFEQFEVPKGVLGPVEKFLRSGMQLPVEFFEGEPVTVALPEVAEVRVAETTPAAHTQQETAWKEARLENGLRVQVPLFVGPDETVRVEVKTGRYVGRVHAERKRGA